MSATEECIGWRNEVWLTHSIADKKCEIVNREDNKSAVWLWVEKLYDYLICVCRLSTLVNNNLS